VIQILLIVTVPSGFEHKALRELQEIFPPRQDRAHFTTTYFSGILKGRTSLSVPELKRALEDASPTLVSRVIPLAAETEADFDRIAGWFLENFDFGKLKGRTFRVKCRRRGHHNFKSVDFEKRLGAEILKKGG